MSFWLPFVMVAATPKSRRNRLFRAMLPALVRLPPVQQTAVTAVVADQQVRAEDRRLEKKASTMIQDMKALHDLKGANNSIDDTVLAQHPELLAELNKNIALKEQIKAW